MASMKMGLDYIPVDVFFEPPVQYMKIKHGEGAHEIFIELLKYIYRAGYYQKWGDSQMLVFCSEFMHEIPRVQEILGYCLDNNIFNRKLFERYGILTSRGIQKRYFEIMKRKKTIPVCTEFLLVDMNDYNNLSIVELSEPEQKLSEPEQLTDNGNRNTKNVTENMDIVTEMPVHENERVRKGKGTKRELKGNNICSPEPDEHESEIKKEKDKSFEDDFEEKWEMYPNKKGKNRVKPAQRKRLAKIPNEDMKRAIEKYKKEVPDRQFQMYWWIWFNGEFEDWMKDDPTPSPTTPSTPAFKRFEHPEPKVFEPLDD